MTESFTGGLRTDVALFMKVVTRYSIGQSKMRVAVYPNLVVTPTIRIDCASSVNWFQFDTDLEELRLGSAKTSDKMFRISMTGLSSLR